MKDSDKYLTIAHLIVILIIWISPILFRWWLIILGIIAYYLQLIIFKDCVLTKAQFSTTSREITMYSVVLEVIGFKVNRKIVRLFADYIFPCAILGIALILQKGFDWKPLIF